MSLLSILTSVANNVIDGSLPNTKASQCIGGKTIAEWDNQMEGPLIAKY